MRYAIVACALLLGACGADGPPRYSGETTPGLSVTGELTMGVSKTL